VPESIVRRIGREEIMGRTGVQVMQVNTLYQLVSHFQGKAFLRQAARHFLTIPDLLNY
jgi:sugar (pentulose or hexulose) kinase